MRRVRKRLIVLLGSTACCCLALLTSFWGWLPYFTGVPYAWFLPVTAVIALALAHCITRP